MAVFRVVAPCSVVEVYHRFRAIIALMMEAAITSETLVNFYHTTRRYNPENSHLGKYFFNIVTSIHLYQVITFTLFYHHMLS
jgi:hypothetical protein